MSNEIPGLNILSFPEISISTINCNSLNLSTNASYHHKLKIYGITKLKTDFILLSDVRINSTTNDEKISELKKTFLTNPYCSYNLIFNSKHSSRGVGILTKSTLDVSVAELASDEEGNLLAVKITLRGSDFLLVSVYGPNSTSPGFFARLQKILSDNKHLPLIVGGDWNCTFSRLGIENNIDILNMKGLPNLRHSELVGEYCKKYDLCDPFRCFFPTSREFTYVPRDSNKTNKSRLDFFLISKQLAPFATDCEIIPSFQNKLFDHKAVVLTFYKNKKIGPPRPHISSSIVKDDLIELLVNISVSECYLHHLVITHQDDVQRKIFYLSELGRARAILREIGPGPPELIETR